MENNKRLVAKVRTVDDWVAESGEMIWGKGQIAFMRNVGVAGLIEVGICYRNRFKIIGEPLDRETASKLFKFEGKTKLSPLGEFHY